VDNSIPAKTKLDKSDIEEIKLVLGVAVAPQKVMSRPLLLNKKWDEEYIKNLGLVKAEMSNFIWVGHCPMCLGQNCFILFQHKRQVHCLDCGLTGRIR
jgi:hypothetical protein